MTAFQQFSSPEHLKSISLSSVVTIVKYTNFPVRSTQSTFLMDCSLISLLLFFFWLSVYMFRLSVVRTQVFLFQNWRRLSLLFSSSPSFRTWEISEPVMVAALLILLGLWTRRQEYECPRAAYNLR